MTTDAEHNAAALLASPVRRRLVDALAHQADTAARSGPDRRGAGRR